MRYICGNIKCKMHSILTLTRCVAIKCINKRKTIGIVNKCKNKSCEHYITIIYSNCSIYSNYERSKYQNCLNKIIYNIKLNYI